MSEDIPCTSKQASSECSSRASSARGQTHVLSLATNGFGLRIEETEEEKRRKLDEQNSYEFHRPREGQENYSYVDEHKSKDLKTVISQTLSHFKSEPLDEENDFKPPRPVAQIGDDFIPLMASVNIKQEMTEVDSEFCDRFNLLEPNYNQLLPIFKHRRDVRIYKKKKKSLKLNQ
jgi:hypothetical protein